MSSVFSLSYTATADSKFHLIDGDLWVRDANVHVVTNDAKYGNFDAQAATVAVGSVASFQDFNVKDLFFKNAGAGSNTTVYIVGILMTEGRKQELGVI